MISIKNLNYSYQKDEKPILENLNLEINNEEFICIIGSSGCGKSTVLKLIAGLLKPNGGSIEVDGNIVSSPSIERSIVFQHYSLFPWLTVEGNIIFALKKCGKFDKKEIENRSRFYLESVGMLDSKNKFPYQLSGGMRQRTALARALALDSKYLLLDEPFGALDLKIRRDLQKLTRKICKEEKKTVIMVTHDLNEALSISNRIVFLKNGSIIKDFSISKRYKDTKDDLFYVEDKNNLIKDLEDLYD